MKKSLSILLAVFMIASIMLTACNAKPAASTEAPVTVATEASAATEAPAEDTIISMSATSSLHSPILS